MTDPGLDTLRERIRQLDLEILARAAERVRLARRIGEIKRGQHLPTVDYEQEKVVKRSIPVPLAPTGNCGFTGKLHQSSDWNLFCAADFSNHCAAFA